MRCAALHDEQRTACTHARTHARTLIGCPCPAHGAAAARSGGGASTPATRLPVKLPVQALQQDAQRRKLDAFVPLELGVEGAPPGLGVLQVAQVVFNLRSGRAGVAQRRARGEGQAARRRAGACRCGWGGTATFSTAGTARRSTHRPAEHAPKPPCSCVHACRHAPPSPRASPAL